MDFYDLGAAERTEFVYDDGNYREDDFGEEDIEEEDYDEDEKEEIDLEGDDIKDNDARDDWKSEEMIISFEPSFKDMDRYSKPVSSVSQLREMIRKGKIPGGADKPEDSVMSRFRLENEMYNNRIGNIYPNINFSTYIDDMESFYNKIPNLQFKNPSALFIGFLCTKRKGQEYILGDLDKWKPAMNALNIYCTDVIRYHRLWVKVFSNKV